MKIVNVGINSIHPYGKNPRKNDNAIDKVAASIKEFGFQQPIVVDSGNIIIVGHTRYKAAMKLGLIKVPVVHADNLTDKQVKAYRLADNKTSEFGEWDAELLTDELIDLSSTKFDMRPFGFENIDAASKTINKPDSFRTRPYEKLHFLATVSISEIEKLRELEELCTEEGIEFETMGN